MEVPEKRAWDEVVEAWGTVPLPLAAVIVAVGGALVVALIFPARADYVAHFLAGETAVMLVLALAPGHLATLALTAAPAAVLGVSVVAELLIFGPTVDGMDVAMTTLGAVQQSTCLLRRPNPTASERVALALGGALLLVCAVAFRYTVGDGQG